MRFPTKFNQTVLIYILLKTGVVGTALLFFGAVFGKSYFSYPDFFSNYNDCNLRSVNGLFSGLICALNIESIASPKAIGLAVLLTTLRDIGVLWVGFQLLTSRAYIVVLMLLAFHPYLAVYQARLSTSTFAALGLFLLFWIVRSKQLPSGWYYPSGFLLAGLRSGLAPIFMIFHLVELITALRNGLWRYATLSVAAFVVFYLIILSPETSYAGRFFSSAARYPLSFSSISSWIDSGFPWVDFTLAIPILLISHLILLLGFREAAFTRFPDLFWPLDALNLVQIIIFAALAVLHLIGTWVFFRHYVRLDKRYLLLLLYVFPTFLLVAHLRYFLPLIPFALLGIGLLIDRQK
jgi:hypothetical protein